MNAANKPPNHLRNRSFSILVSGCLLLIAPLFFFLPSSAHAQTQAYGVQQVSAGSAHSCAVTEQGGVKCWGSNSAGQLGDGSTTDRNTQVDVAGLGVGVSAVVNGGVHTCAITSAGGVRCWGSNASGQLGDGSNSQQNTPVNVNGLASGVMALAAGASFTCALTSAGGVKCWGLNSSGQLGDNSLFNRATPVDVQGLTANVAGITAGSNHTCALLKSGGMKCWGSNANGQLGDNSTIQRSTAVDVIGLANGVAAIAAGGSHTCASTASGGAKCWGDNVSGDLGDNTATQRSTPVDVIGLTSGVSAVTVGAFHSCALMASGAAKCWGANTFGQLGDTTTAQRNAPVSVPGFNLKVASLMAGNYHTCAVTTGGSLKCWGSNSSGQLGDNTTSNRTSLIGVNGLSFDAAMVAGGQSFTCSPDTGGSLRCWGKNDYGQLGNNTAGESTFKSVPNNVVGLSTGMVSVKEGQFHSCGLTAAGGVKCWGTNNSSELGLGSAGSNVDLSSVPLDVVGLSSGVVAIDVGRYHSCALTNVGGVKCWGYNFYGELGDNTTQDRSTPVDVIGATSGIKAIALGHYHSCALTTGGIVKCWGANNDNEFGDNGASGAESHIAVNAANGVTGALALAVGASHGCVLTATGGMKCWGDNAGGQIGTATTTSASVPVDVAGLDAGVASIAANDATSCAVMTTGALKCWGHNTEGELGDSTIDNRLTPTDVVGLGSGVAEVALGRYHACARLVGGGLKCWGANTFGEVGDTTSTQANENANIMRSEQRNTPVYVFGFATRPVITASVNPSASNQGVSYSVLVSGNNPAGTVTFKANGVTIPGCGAIPISNSSASCGTIFNAVGTRIITATYSGDSLNASSMGALAAEQVVTAATLVKRVATDIDGTGKSALIVRSSNGNISQAGRLVNNQFQFTPLPDAGSNYRSIGIGDFNGNGKADLAFQDITQGEFGDVSVLLDYVTGAAQFSRKVKLPWIVQAVGDLDGDGFDDMVFRFTGDDGIPNDTGVSYIWFMNGSTVNQVRKRGGAPLNWTLVGAADINGDGAADMVYVSPANQVRVLMATPQRTCANFSGGNLPAGFQALKVADFTGLGRGDILHRNPASGVTMLLALDATQVTLPPPSANPDDPNASCTSTTQPIATTSYLLPAVDTTWQFYATGDFNGDGIVDIVWKQPNGTLTLWLMGANGVPNIIANAGTAPTGFSVAQP